MEKDRKYRLNTRQKKTLFLKALDARLLNVTKACEAASICRSDRKSVV